MDFIDTNSTLDDNDMEEFRRRYPQEDTEMTTLTERLRTEGRHAGVEGMLRKQVELKYGPIPHWADNRISQANDDQLEQWVTSIFSADTLEDLLGEHE